MILKNKSIIRFIIIMLLFTISFLPSKVLATNSILKETSINIGVGEVYNIYNSVNNNYKRVITYKVAKNKVIKYDKKGNVKGLIKGQVNIFVKYKSKQETLKVIIKDAPKGIKLSTNNIGLGVGERYRIKINIQNGVSKAVKYSISNSNVISYKNGIITAKKVGSAIFSVKTYNGKIDKCKVIVKKAPNQVVITNSNNNVIIGSSIYKVRYKIPNGGISNKNSYFVSDGSVAEVSSTGYIKAKKLGNVTVTIKTYNNKTASKVLTIIPDSMYKKAIEQNVNSIQLSMDLNNVQRVNYGTSVMDKNLEAFIITNSSNNNNYNKTLFMDFAVHGFEDEYSNDGKVLVKAANDIIRYFAYNSKQLGKYRLVIVPTANPDGVINGRNNYRCAPDDKDSSYTYNPSTAFGRCTKEGVDINRDFGVGRFKAQETKYLSEIIINSKPNIYLNVHGWLDGTYGDNRLNNIINSKLGLSHKSSNIGIDKGYATGWVYSKLNIPVSLVEYKNSKSVNLKSNVDMIRAIISEYK